MLYALYLFRKRTRQILTRSTMRYDDQHGPVLLTTLLVLVTLVCIVLALYAFRASLASGVVPEGVKKAAKKAAAVNGTAPAGADASLQG
jgi:hypothetical protein